MCDCAGCRVIRAREQPAMPYWTTLWIEVRHAPWYTALSILLGVAGN